MIHIYFANVLLQNFIIAILSETYANMRDSGIFRYKVNLFMYCERYIIAFEDENYGELVLHPAPTCILLLPVVFLMPTKAVIKPLNKAFSYFLYWIENIFIIIFFAIYEIVLYPIMVIVIGLHLILGARGKC
jgi:hypothetical protein